MKYKPHLHIWDISNDNDHKIVEEITFDKVDEYDEYAQYGARDKDGKWLELRVPRASFESNNIRKVTLEELHDAVASKNTNELFNNSDDEHNEPYDRIECDDPRASVIVARINAIYKETCDLDREFHDLFDCV